ncbi:hypothetical protein BDZ97DRAFT_1765033 [Flammula alnicola]|nr:hypothetical protein BDZ97DRAFT_1765033 [Flammula alnicola]
MSASEVTLVEQPGYGFDYDLLNVPEAQDEYVYAIYETLNDKLGLDNAYIPPPPVDEISLAKKHDPRRIYSRNLSNIRMEDLDNGTGRMACVPMMSTSTKARDESLEQERLGRLYEDENPHCAERAAGGFASLKRKAGCCANPYGTHCAETDAPHPTFTTYETAAERRAAKVPLAAAYVPTHFYNSSELPPYEAFFRPEPGLREFPDTGVAPHIDPCCIDPSGWAADYRQMPKRPRRTGEPVKVVTFEEKTAIMNKKVSSAPKKVSGSPKKDKGLPKQRKWRPALGRMLLQVEVTRSCRD